MSVPDGGFDEENLSEQELIGLVHGGDEKAMALLLFRMMPLVKRRAAVYAPRSSTDIEDLVQEGLMGLLCAVNTYRSGEASFKTYASVCINNRIVSAVKASLRQKNLPLHNYVLYEEDGGEAAVVSDDVLNPEEQLIAKEEEARIYRLMDENLSGFEHTVLQLFLSGHSYDEIGALTNSSAKSADNALQRVRRKLKAAFAYGSNA